MKPLILAAGKGERYKGDTIKPLMVVNGRPVILDALYTLGRMGFVADEIYIATNIDNRSTIQRAIGDRAINLIVQNEITGPATAVKAAFDAEPKLTEILVIQADDAAWFDPIMRDFAQSHDRSRPVASMALLSTGDPGVHSSTYEVNPADMITGYHSGLPDQKHSGQGCNAGIYVVGRDSFMVAYRAVGPPLNNDIGIPAVVNHMIDNGLPVRGPLYEIPWKSANSIGGLEAARSVSRSSGDILHRASLAETIAFNSRVS